jgi:alkane 1-monooxygenase
VLAPSGYGHFFVEHNRGHQVRVATPEDPASAWLGESFWAFLPRTVKGSLTSACELEREWLARNGRAWWSIHNNVLNAWAMTVVLFASLTAVFGLGVLPYPNPMRRFQALRHFDEAPQLPTGYAGMILLALVPPLWRRVMDPRLIEHYGRRPHPCDHPPARARPRARAVRKRRARRMTNGADPGHDHR